MINKSYYSSTEKFRLSSGGCHLQETTVLTVLIYQQQNYCYCLLLDLDRATMNQIRQIISENKQGYLDFGTIFSICLGGFKFPLLFIIQIQLVSIQVSVLDTCRTPTQHYKPLSGHMQAHLSTNFCIKFFWPDYREHASTQIGSGSLAANSLLSLFPCYAAVHGDRLFLCKNEKENQIQVVQLYLVWYSIQVVLSFLLLFTLFGIWFLL